MMNEIDQAYTKWVEDPNPQSMAQVVKALSPTINSEIQQFSGPKQLLRQRAKILTIKAVKNYDPLSKAKLRSWVVTNMQPLKRYNRELGNAVHVPEQAQQQAAFLNRRAEEYSAEHGEEPSDGFLADEIGISVDRVKNLRSMSKAVVYDGTVKTDAETNVSDLAVDSGRDGRIDAAVDTVYNSLDARDQMIYDLKTGTKGGPALDNKGIAKRLGVSPGLVSQRSADISNMILEARNRV
jgi:DNA-directed RNA polymerase specialized sigma subunit